MEGPSFIVHTSVVELLIMMPFYVVKIELDVLFFTKMFMKSLSPTGDTKTSAIKIHVNFQHVRALRVE